MCGSRFRVISAVVLLAVLVAPSYANEDKFTLAGAIPDDVFIYVATQNNPEREFLNEYWGEVLDALSKCGIGEDLMKLLGGLLDAEQQAEFDRLKALATELVDGVDWGQLAGREFVFVERFPAFEGTLNGQAPALMPDMVWMFRGSGDGAADNYAGLVAILQAIVDEINKAIGSDVLVVEKAARSGAEVATADMLRMLIGAPPLKLSVVKRGDLVMIAMGQSLLDDVLGLMEGSSSKKALADDPNFKSSFGKLPPAEDSMFYFDMPNLIEPIVDVLDLALGGNGWPQDVYVNAHINDESNKLNAKAIAAYQVRDIKKALAETEKAYEISPGDCVVLYNLACFNALLGNQEKALGWLEKAVEGGFYAPSKIASDSDLNSLRDDPRYKAAHAKAGELAAQYSADDVVINSSKSGEAYRLTQDAWIAYEEGDYERGLKLCEQALQAAPDDSRVLYYLACFHALLEHEDKALDFLQKAVAGGFYCPQHISSDPDLKNIRGDERYDVALAEARSRAAAAGSRKGADEKQMVRKVIDRLANAVGILDHCATVEFTDGYSVHMESLVVLAADAKDRPIYPVFGKRKPLTNFDRFLPQETLSFAVSGGFDLGELYKFLEDTIRVIGPKGEELLVKWAAIQKEYGFDVNADFLDWFDGDSITVTLDDGQGSVMLVKVTDEEVAREKVTAGIEFLTTKLSELMTEVPMLAMMAVRTSPVLDERLEGFQNLHFSMSPAPVVWGVAEGYLIFSDSADAVAMCLDTAKGKHPNIKENARVMAEALVPDGPFASVSLTDQRNLGQELEAIIGVVSMVSGMMTMAIPEPEAQQAVSKVAGMIAKLGPVVRKIDFYKSTATVVTFDGKAWYTHTVTHYVSPEEHAKGKPM